MIFFCGVRVDLEMNKEDRNPLRGIIFLFDIGKRGPLLVHTGYEQVSMLPQALFAVFSGKPVDL